MKNKSKISVLASVRYPDDTCKVLLRFNTQDGRFLKKVVDMAIFDDAKLLQKKLRGFLCDLAGAMACMKAATVEGLIQNIQQQSPRKVKLVVTQRGWQDELAFVGPTGLMGPEAGKYFLDTEQLSSGAPMVAKGTLELWQKGVVDAMKLSPVLTVSLGMALATPLMKFFGSNVNRLIILVAPTSSGKTTVEQVLMSLNTSPDPMELVTFNMTAAALTSYMSKFSDIPTIVDELGSLAKKGVTAQDKLLDMIYSISSQAGRRRHEKAGYSLEMARTLVFTSSEGVIHYEKDGQRVRMLNLPAAEEEGYGIFTAKVGGKVAATKAYAKLIKTVENNYAHAGPAFVSHVLDEISRRGQADFQNLLRRRSKNALAELGVGAGIADKRTAEPFAWALIALRMAMKAGLLPGLDDQWVLKSVKSLYSGSCRLMDEDAEQRRLLMVKLAGKMVQDASNGSRSKFAWLSNGDYYIRRKTVREWLKKEVPNRLVFAKMMEDIELLAGKEKGRKWTLTREFSGEGKRPRYMAIPEKIIKSYTKSPKSAKSQKTAKKRQK